MRLLEIHEMALAVKLLLGAAVASTAVVAWVVRSVKPDREASLRAIRAAEHAEI